MTTITITTAAQALALKCGLEACLDKLAAYHKQESESSQQLWERYFDVDGILDEIKAYESLGLSYEDAPLTIEVECLSDLIGTDGIMDGQPDKDQ